jgi:uncharacterized membrane protein
LANDKRTERTLPGLTIAARSFGLLAIEGLSIGLALWESRSSERLVAYVTSNAVSSRARHHVVQSMAAGALVAALIGMAAVWLKPPRELETARRLAYRSAPLSLAAFVPLLFNWRLWVGRDLDFLVLASVFALSLLALIRLSLETQPAFAMPLTASFAERVHRMRQPIRHVLAWRWLPISLVATAALAYAVYFSIHTLNTHYRIETSVYDLGVENNLVWNAIHWAPLFRSTPLGGSMTHLGYHQTYFSYVLGIVYRLAPRPETLLVIQAVMLGFAAIPLYLLATRRLGAWIGCMFGLLYLFYAPLHGSNLYDFHYQPLGVFFLWLTLYLLEERRDRWAVLAVLLTLSVREDMSALLAVLGAYLLLTGERPRAGLIVMAIGACYFVVLKFLIMPRFLAGESSYLNQYAGLLPPGESGFSGVLKTALGNPGFALKTLLEKDKLIYVLQLLTPLAFLSVRRPVSLLLLAPGFFFTLLSTKHVPSISISFQYTAYWTPFVFIAAIANLAWISEAQGRGVLSPASRNAWLLVLPIAMLITSYQHGAILQHNTARAHFIPYRFGISAEDRQRHDDLYALIAQVPALAKVVSAEWVVPHVSSRPDSYALRDSVFDAEYMILSLSAREDELETIRSALGSGAFGVVEERGQFVLARRGYPTLQNHALLARLGER